MKLRKFDSVEIDDDRLVYYGQLFVGDTAQIKAIWNSINRHSDVCRITSLFTERPHFGHYRTYGLLVEEYYGSITMAIVSPDTVLEMVLDDFKEVR